MSVYLGDTGTTLYLTPYCSIDSDESYFLATVGWLYWEIGILIGDLP